MPKPEFAELVSRLLERMGQQVSTIRQVPEGLLLKTGDGFLYAFLEDPTQVSLGAIQRLAAEVGDAPMKLAVLTPGRLPLALHQEVTSKQGTVVDGARFAELARGLDLGSYLGDEPRPPPSPTQERLLPSARQLDEIMGRAKTWLDWGVPALSLRFYRQAATLKPEFGPARIGIGKSLLALGLSADADRAFSEVLAAHPGDLDARLGRAAVMGARGRTEDEVRVYRSLLEEAPSRVDVRAHLVAALVAEGKWPEARKEIELMLTSTPEDPPIRFLHAASLWKTNASSEGDRELTRARELGLTLERETTLREHLGLPPLDHTVAGTLPAAPRATRAPARKVKAPVKRPLRPPPRRPPKGKRK